MAGFQAEVKALQAAAATSVAPLPHTEEEGCCPGKEGEPWIKCTTILVHLKQDINVVFHNYEALDSDLQEMSKLTKTMDARFSPLTVQVKEFSTQITGVCATAAVQQIQIDNTL
ncbi:hypothetical protein DSO57_1018666 [Entomophthora muscae]|uniref:Uncharacterized protein n=1 Tax=Entomophthora muscae TaxID=34485 RepID=A0ACC2U2R5_9FUNG|nr:hypothetical protein DSO57_1018666 [Entomophthora muscae]